MDKKILIVDDSPLIHNLLRKILESQNYTVCGDAKNGQEAIKLYEETKPDVVFMDITMPVMDGLAATANIKEKHPDARIIMLTAMGDEEIVQQANEVGVSVFVQKPFDEYKIVSALAQLGE